VLPAYLPSISISASAGSDVNVTGVRTATELVDFRAPDAPATPGFEEAEADGTTAFWVPVDPGAADRVGVAGDVNCAGAEGVAAEPPEPE